MGKRLETFAVDQAIKLSGLTDCERFHKNKRRSLFAAIMDGIGEAIVNWLIDLEYGETCWDVFQQDVPRLPDGIAIDRENRIAYFIEIEDSHPLSEDRLDLYGRAFWHLDSVYWQLKLITADRYGNPNKPTDLAAWTAAKAQPNG